MIWVTNSGSRHFKLEFWVFKGGKDATLKDWEDGEEEAAPPSQERANKIMI